MPMGTGEKSKEKYVGQNVVADFKDNCRYTEKKEREHCTLMNHKHDSYKHKKK